jgi:hypothetical protein
MGRKSWSDRRTVEQCRALSIARLVSDRLIVNGFSGSQSSLHPIRWSDGFEVIARYEQRNPDEGTLRLVYTIGGERTEDQIEVTSIPSPLGYGRRYYFKCGGIGGLPCGRRVGKLYKPPGEVYFACRTCYNLTYRSSKEHNKRLDALLRLSPAAISRLLQSADWNLRLLAMRAALRMRSQE